MYNAIIYRPNYINHVDFIAHEKDHEHQVNRMTSMRAGTYGFDDLPRNKKQKTYADEFEQEMARKAKTQPIQEGESDAEEPQPTKPQKQAAEKTTAKKESPEKEKQNSLSLKNHVDDALDGNGLDNKEPEENISFKKEIKENIENGKKDDDQSMSIKQGMKEKLE